MRTLMGVVDALRCAVLLALFGSLGACTWGRHGPSFSVLDRLVSDAKSASVRYDMLDDVWVVEGVPVVSVPACRWLKFL